jgi:four helix bundle protein
MTNGELEPWEDGEGTLHEEPEVPLVYDLEERTARFGEAVIDFLKLVPVGPRTERLISQLTGCATSVGANYCEADDAVSKKEFIKVIGTCRKEARESKFQPRMMARACPEVSGAARTLWREANSLHLISSKIRRTAQSNQRDPSDRLPRE